MHLFKRLKSALFVPERIRTIAALVDFAGPRVSGAYRRFLFRLFGGLLAGSIYQRIGVPRLQARLGGLLSGFIYRVETRGLERLPAGGFIMLPNHTGIIDAIVLQLIFPRSIRFVAKDGLAENPWLGPVLGLGGASSLLISATRAKQALREASEKVKKGEVICIFPEGALSHGGALLQLKRGYELLARMAGCEVVPVWVDGLHGSIFTYEDGRYRFRWPRRLPLAVTVAFGEPMPAAEAVAGSVRQHLVELGARCFERRPALAIHLGRTLVGALRRDRHAPALVDALSGRCLSRGRLLAESLALSRWVRVHRPARRVALPSAAAGWAAWRWSAALALADKVALMGAAAPGEGDAPLPDPDVLLRGGPGGIEAPARAFWAVAAAVAPGWLLGALLGLPRRGGLRTAAVLRPGPGAGEVALSHRHLLSNAAQLGALPGMGSARALVAAPCAQPEPGTFGLLFWYGPLGGGCTLSRATMAEGCAWARRFGAQSVLSSADLLATAEGAGYQTWRGLSLLLVGAAPLCPERAEALAAQLGCALFEGHAPRAAAAVLSLNGPDLKMRPNEAPQPYCRAGSSGRLLPGQAAQVHQPGTGAPVSPHQPGALWVRAPGGGTGADGQGWVPTGYLAHFDADGFLHLDEAPTLRRTVRSDPAGTSQPAPAIESSWD